MPSVETPSAEGERRYELKITATGVVRDAAGNIVSQEPVEATAVMTEAEARRANVWPSD